MAITRSSRTCGDEVDEHDDRISNLPEDVIHYILSFLDTIDVVRASVVSRKWRCFWLSMPYLKLYNRSLDYVDSVDNNEKFKFFVNWVLLSQNGSTNIKRFSLHFRSRTDTDDQTLYRWISVVTRRSVQEFELMSSQPIATFKLPYCLVTCKSLVELKLLFGRENVLQLPTYTGFSRLKSLCIAGVQLLDSISFRNFISSCPVLEILVMLGCTFSDFKVLDISSTSLKNLSIVNNRGGPSDSFNYEVKVACSNLLSFMFKAKSALVISFEGLNSLQNVFISLSRLIKAETDEECCSVMCKILEGIRNTKVLKLSSCPSQLLCMTLKKPECFSTSFCNLKSLVLRVGKSGWQMQSTINFLEYTPNLKALIILLEEQEPTVHWEVTDKAILCLTYHLNVVELLEVNGSPIELELVRFLLRNGHVLQKMIIGWEKSVEDRKMIITELMSFPRASSNVALKFLEPKVVADIKQYYYRNYNSGN